MVVVDCLGAAATNNLKENAYIIDTNGYEGSWNEGTSKLVSVCQDGQGLSWSVASVNPGNQVNLESFSGQMLDSNICKPQKQGIPGAEAWKGNVQSRGGIGLYQYNLNLSVDGKGMSFYAYIKVV